jgi:hypothetical protein
MRIPLALALAALALPAPASSLECVDYSPHVLPTGTLFTEDTVYDLESSGSLAYALSQWSLDVYRVHSSGRMKRIGGGLLDHTAIEAHLTLGEDLAYVGFSVVGPLWLDLLDLSDPLAPTPVATVTLPGIAKGVAEANGHAFVAADAAGLQVVDVGVPESPVIVASAPTPANAEDIALLGDLALVAARSEGLVVFDVSNPLAPSELGSLPVPAGDWAWRVGAAEPRMAIVASYSLESNAGLLMLIDVSDPTNPVEEGSLPLSGRPERLATDGDRAYVSHRGYGSPSLQIVELHGRGAPVTRSVVQLGGWTNGLTVLDSERVVLSSKGIDAATSKTVIRAVEIRAGTLTDALHLTDAVEPLVGMEGTTALTSIPASALGIRDASDEDLPLIGSVTLPSSMQIAAKEGDVVVAAVSRGLWFVDASDLASPQAISSMDELTDVRWLDVHESHAYVSAISPWDSLPPSHHRIIDVSDLANPMVVYEEEGMWGPFAFHGDHAYAGGTTLRIFEVSDPAHPVELPDVYVDGHTIADVGVLADRLVLVLAPGLEAWSCQLRTYDLTVPGAPVEVGRVPLAMAPETVHPNALALTPGWAYVTGRYGMQVFRTLPPDLPELVGIVPHEGIQMRRVFATDDHVFIYRRTSGSNEPIGVLAHPCSTSAVDAIVSGTDGIPLRAFPNPFRAATNIELDRPLGADGRALVYDVAGRRVADLTRTLAPGRRSLRWDGRGPAGRAVSTGVYFLRVREGDRTRSLRLVRLR